MPTHWLPVPHRTQRHKADCLVACVAMVLDYLEKPIDYERLTGLLDIEPDIGGQASNVRHLSVLGISVYYGTGTLDDLARYIAQDIPCIAFVNTANLSYWPEASRHAVVVVGWDAERVYLNDPFFEAAPQSISHLEFELAWEEFDNAYAVLRLP